MKIAQIVCVFRPYRGGIGEVSYHYAMELVKRGHEVTVFTPQYDSLELSEEVFDGIKIKRVSSFLRYGNASFLYRLFFLLESYDVIHLHYPFYGAAEVIWLYKLFFKKFQQRFVMTYHMDVVGEGFMKLFFSTHAKFLMPSIVRCMDGVIASSFDYIRYSDASNVYRDFPNRFIELPFGVGSIFTKRLKNSECIDSSGLNVFKRKLLFVGGLDRAHAFKGLSVLLRALRVCDDPELALIIVGDGDCKNFYMEEVRALDIESRVFFLGRVSDDALVDVYNVSDVCVLPSVKRNEAFGLVLVQAFACGKPVIASALPGVRTVVDHGINGLTVIPCDVDDLVKAIKSICNDPATAEKMGEEGLKKVKSQYNWEIIGEKLECYLNSL